MAEPAERQHLDLSVEVNNSPAEVAGPETTQSSKRSKADPTVGSQLVLLSG